MTEGVVFQTKSNIDIQIKQVDSLVTLTLNVCLKVPLN